MPAVRVDRRQKPGELRGVRADALRLLPPRLRARRRRGRPVRRAGVPDRAKDVSLLREALYAYRIALRLGHPEDDDLRNLGDDALRSDEDDETPEGGGH